MDNFLNLCMLTEVVDVRKFFPHLKKSYLPTVVVDGLLESKNVAENINF